jgi:2'-5' RNA ligase
MEPEQIEEMYIGISDINFMSHLQIELSSVSFFPNEDSQLLAGLVKPTNQLQKIFERVDEVVTRIGFGSSLKTYKPHITLGRFKDKTRTQYSFEAFEDIQITSRVNALDVYESEFDQGRTSYNLLRRIEF